LKLLQTKVELAVLASDVRCCVENFIYHLMLDCHKQILRAHDFCWFRFIKIHERASTRAECRCGFKNRVYFTKIY